MSAKPTYEELQRQLQALEQQTLRYTEAEEALRKSEERYRCIVENSHNAIFMLDDRYRFVYVNNQFCELTGYRREDIMERDFRPFLDEDQRTFLENIYLRRLRGENVFSRYHFYLTRKDGERRKVEIRASAVSAPRGRERTVGFMLDITQRNEALKQLRASEEQFRLLAENANDVIWTRDLDLHLTYISPSVERIRGYTPEEAMRQSPREILTPESYTRIMAFYQTALERENTDNPIETPYVVELEEYCKDGATIWVEASMAWLRNAEGEITGIIGVGRDITYRKQVQEALQESEKRYRTILEEIQDAYFEVDIRGNLTFFNRQMGTLLGYSERELLGMNNRKFMDEMNAALVYRTFNHVYRLEEPSKGFDWKLIRKDNSEIWVNTSVSLIKDSEENKVGFRGIIRDITQKKEMEKQLHRMAYFDELTGLANRSLLQDRFNKAIARAYRYGSLLAVYVVDMNQTKEINDTLGHSAGDEMIRGVAQRLRQSVRESDTVARTGGDEFVILGEAIHLERGAWELGQKIVNTIKSRPFMIQGNTVFQEISVGFSIYPLDSNDKESLLRQADVAMYYAKESLSTRPHRYSFQNDQLSTQFSLAQELRRAIEQNQFVVFYQPQVNLKTREMIGMEALLRWNHPEKGLISPSDFIPVLERTGLIRTVGLRVEQSVCQQIAEWKKQKRVLTQKTINCCIYELNNPVMLDELMATIKKYDIESSLIGIEITERVATRQIEEVRKVLQALSDAGISILLDDFGTGYSSLSLLQKLPIDIVKIDKSFIQSITSDKYSASLVRSIITMCHETDKKVMAEGIETEEQLEFLLKLQCDYGQGFLFGHPAPPESVYDF